MAMAAEEGPGVFGIKAPAATADAPAPTHRAPAEPVTLPPATTGSGTSTGAADARSKSRFADPDSGSATGLATGPFLPLHRTRQADPYRILSRRLQNCSATLRAGSIGGDAEERQGIRNLTLPANPVADPGGVAQDVVGFRLSRSNACPGQHDAQAQVQQSTAVQVGKLLTAHAEFNSAQSMESTGDAIPTGDLPLDRPHRTMASWVPHRDDALCEDIGNRRNQRHPGHPPCVTNQSGEHRFNEIRQGVWHSPSPSCGPHGQGGASTGRSTSGAA